MLSYNWPMQLITVTRGRDSGRGLAGVSSTPLQQFCAVLQVSIKVAEHLLTKPRPFSQTQRKKRSKWLGGNTISDENSSCKEPELEREERWKLLFNPMLSTRISLQFIEADTDILSATHLKPNYLKACTWSSRFWIKGGEKKVKEQQNKERLLYGKLVIHFQASLCISHYAGK